MSEEQPMMTTAELSNRLAVSEDTALRIMRKTPGVLRLSTGARTLYRMPQKVYETLLTRASKAVAA